MSGTDTSRRLRFRLRDAALATLKLSTVMSLLFVSLTIPVLIFILVYNYKQTSSAIIATLHEQVAKTRVATIESAQHLLQPVGSMLRVLAGGVAADPAFFRTEPSGEILYRALTSADYLDAVWASFEDGYHRAVTRIDDDRRRSDPRIPQSANWHSNYMDAFSVGANRLRHRTFYDTWPHVVGAYAVPTTVDMRTLPHYKAAKATGTLAVTELLINLDTGYPILQLGYPILFRGRFIGFTGASVTVDDLSRFLDRNRASPHSTTPLSNAVERSSRTRTAPSRSGSSTASSWWRGWPTARTMT